MSLSNYSSRGARRSSFWAGPVGQFCHNDFVKVHLDSEPVASNLMDEYRLPEAQISCLFFFLVFFLSLSFFNAWPNCRLNSHLSNVKILYKISIDLSRPKFPEENHELK